MPNYKLSTLVEKLKIPNGTFHRAEEDSVYCGLLFARIVEALEKAGQPASVHALLDLAKQPPMKFPQYEARPQQLGLF
jgi:DNA polymerase III epsilon subunit-like protein